MSFQPGTFQREVARGFTAIPTLQTDVTTTDTDLFQIVLVNSTGASIAFTLQDKQGTPVVPFNGANGFTVDPGTPFTFSVANGVRFKGGMSWLAGGAGLYADVIATYKG